MSKKVLIIGGGFTGLTAALRLAQSDGVEVTLVEQAAELGGLAAGFQMAGTSLEKTYHYLFTTDENAIRLARELGVEDKLFWAETTNAIFLNGKVHPFASALDVLRFSPCSLASRLRTGLAIFYLMRRKDWRGLSPQRAHDWMMRACGRSGMDTIWTPLLKGKFGSRYAEVSMAWLWTRIHTRANSRSPGSGEKLGYFRGGFNVLVSAITDYLRERGVKVMTGASVEHISDQRTATIDGTSIPFDACIFTGSSGAFARLVTGNSASGGYLEKLDSIGYLGAVCLVFTSDQALGDAYWVNVNEPGAPFLVFINHTRLVGCDLYQGKHAYYIGAYLPVDDARYRMTDEELTRLWFGYLPHLCPAFDRSQVSEQRIFRFKAAQHVVDTQYEEKIPPYQTPVPGVYLANFSQIFPEDRGTNFAIREGEKIAALVQRELHGSAAG
jgi:protoporphyrinogen oxidase